MKKALGCSVQIALILALVVLVAVPITCIATATAPMHSPKLAEPFICPPGTHIEAEWYQASWNRPGERTLSVTCVDANGRVSSTLPQDSNFWWGGMRVYFPYAFIPLLAVGAALLAALNVIGFGIGRLWKRLTDNRQANSG